MQPAYLELKETADGSIDVTWKVPFYKGRPLPIVPVFPESGKTSPNRTPPRSATPLLFRWKINPADHLARRRRIVIEGPRARLTDVLLRAQPHRRTIHTPTSSAPKPPPPPSSSMPEPKPCSGTTSSSASNTSC